MIEMRITKKTDREVFFLGLYFFLTGFLILSFTALSLAQVKPDWKQGWEKALIPSYVIPPPDAKFFSGEPKPGYRYRLSHSEENVKRTAEEEKILKELFGR